MFAAVMIDMRRPNPADTVCAAMEDIIEEIIDEQRENPSPPGERDVEKPILIYPIYGGHSQPAGQYARDHAAGPQCQRCRHVFDIIFDVIAIAAHEKFDRHRHDKKRNRIKGWIGKTFHVFLFTALSATVQQD